MLNLSITTPSKYSWLTAMTVLTLFCAHPVFAAENSAGQGDVASERPQLFMQIQAGSDHPEASVFHIRGRFSGAPWYVPHHNLGKEGLIPGAAAGTRASNRLEPGEASPWVEIGSILSRQGLNRIRIRAVRSFTREVEDASFTLRLSTTPGGEGLLREIERTGPGSGLLFTVDQDDLANILSDVEWSAAARREAEALGPVPGKVAKQFPLATSVRLSGSVLGLDVLRNEAAVMEALGINGVRIPSGLTQFDHIRHGIYSGVIWHLATDGSLANPQVERLEAHLAAALDTIEQTDSVDQVLAFKLMDEPAATTIEDLAADAVAREQFVAFLQDQNLELDDLGLSDWSQARPTEDQSNAQLYVQSVRFQSQVVADYFARATRFIQERQPGLLTTANFDNALTYRGNMLARGIDWFAIQRQGALTYGWSEDWCNHATTYQFSGLICDMLRAACRPGAQSFGMYNILANREGWEVEAKAAAEIGRGASALHYFNYGPAYALSSDQNSTRYDLYPSLRRINHAIGEVEDELINAEVPPARLAMLYSHSTDTWMRSEDYSPFGKEMLHLWLLARHLNEPIDFVTEDDVEQSALSQYRGLIVAGSHMTRPASEAIDHWVRQGGLLLLGPGAAQRDLWNAPLDLLERLQIQARSFKVVDNPGRDSLDLPRLKPLDEVTVGDDVIPAVSGVQAYETMPSSQVQTLARFKDGTPAVTRVQVEQGQVYAMGVFLGLSYGHVAHRSLAEARRADRSISVRRPRAEDFPATHRQLFAQMIQSLGPAVATTSHPLVQVDLLQGEQADVLVVSNWTGQAIEEVRVRLEGEWAHRSNIRAVQTDRVKVQRRPDRIDFVLPVNAFEFIVLK